MNAREMMELIVLGIGLQHGIIRPALYSVMVLMTIVTALLTSPVLERVYVRYTRARCEHAAASGQVESATIPS